MLSLVLDDGVGFGFWGGGTETSWKVWIGRASKNSCATINGVVSGPMECQQRWEVDVIFFYLIF